MLGIIQRLDPPGVGARDLRECLLLQLGARPTAESLTYRLVDEAFPDLIAHRWNDLAKRFGVEPGRSRRPPTQLARFDPKPGLKYSDQERRVHHPRPDRRQDRRPLPRVPQRHRHAAAPALAGPTRRSPATRRSSRRRTASSSRHKMNSANWMIQAIEQRRQTMLKVMNFIVDRQRDFFEKGIEYLKPLTLREVAEVINMHESTVSRVTNEKYVQTPRGVLPLKFFFSSALSTASGEDASARSIRAKLEKMVAEERPGQAAHRPADRAPLPGAGHPDRPPHGRQVPRPARHPPGPDAEAGMTAGAADAVDVSVLVPAKDEAENLPEFLRLCARRCARRGVHLRGRGRQRRLPATRPRPCWRELGAPLSVSPGGDPPAAAGHRRRAPLRRRRGPGRHLRLLSRRPAVPPGGHPRAGAPRSSSGRGRHRHRHQAGEVREGVRLRRSTTGSAAGSSASA